MNPPSGWRTANIKIRAKHTAEAELVRPRPELEDNFEVFMSSDGFSAYIKRDVLAFIKQHAKLNGRNETIGLLCGRICRDPNGRSYTLVMAAGDAQEGEFQSTPGDVRLLASGDTKLRRRLAIAHPDREIVGWYHTHPSFAPRFSTVDFSEQKTWSNLNHIGIVFSGVDKTEPFGVYRGPRAILLEPLYGVTAGANVLGTGEIDKRIPVAAMDQRLSPRSAPLPVTENEPRLATRPSPGYRGPLIATLIILAGICLIEAIGFLWLSRRVSAVERAVHALTAVSRENTREQPRSVSEITKSTPADSASSPESVERVNRVSDPELDGPAKPLLPESRSRPVAQASGTGRSRPATAGPRRNKNKRTTSEAGKNRPPHKQLSQPGERIMPAATPKESPLS